MLINVVTSATSAVIVYYLLNIKVIGKIYCIIAQNLLLINRKLDVDSHQLDTHLCHRSELDRRLHESLDYIQLGSHRSPFLQVFRFFPHCRWVEINPLNRIDFRWSYWFKESKIFVGVDLMFAPSVEKFKEHRRFFLSVTVQRLENSTKAAKISNISKPVQFNGQFIFKLI